MTKRGNLAPTGVVLDHIDRWLDTAQGDPMGPNSVCVNRAELLTEIEVALVNGAGPAPVPGVCINPTMVDDEEQMCAECVPCLSYIADYWCGVASEVDGALSALLDAAKEARDRLEVRRDEWNMNDAAAAMSLDAAIARTKEVEDA